MPKCSVCGSNKVVGRMLCRAHYQASWRRGELDQHALDKRPISERLLEKIERKETGCWEWTAGMRSDGYGLIWFEGKAQRAHRISYQTFKGPLKRTDVLCHKCDNRKCVNPDHIFIGTRADNVRDAASKDRMPYGNNHWNAVLSDAQIAMIRSIEGVTHTEIARQFGVAQSTISRIRAGVRRAKT